MQSNEKTYRIKELSKYHGFDHCGIAQAAYLDDDARRLESWLINGFQGSMSYMENHFDLRTDPQKLVPGAKSVITLLKNYYTTQTTSTASPKISKYAYGKDYHMVIRNDLKKFAAELKKFLGDFHGRGFVDSAPVLERTWANRSGLGWIGKNGNLINKNAGSFFFIATLIIDAELEYDAPFAADHCGTCTRCIDACPTDAIVDERIIDGSKCISYFTIELKDALIPDKMKGKFDNWMFGCDICQDVCPWNRFATQHKESRFQPIPEILNLSSEEWENMTEETFKNLFAHSPLKRSKFEGIQRNLRFIKTDLTSDNS